MTSRSFILSSKGLKNLILNDDDEISIIIFNQTIKIKKLLVEFLSPRISNILKTDPTIDTVDFNKMMQHDDSFQLPKQFQITQETIFHIENLLNGEQIEIKEGEEMSLRLLSIMFGNEEMYNKINKMYSSEKTESNIDKYLEELNFLSHFPFLSKDFNYSSIIDIISSNLYLIDQTKLLQFPKSIIYSIISNDHLIIDTEDSLLDFIYSIFNKNKEEEENYEINIDNDINIMMFYEKVQFNMLSNWKFNNFIEDFVYYEMTNELWRNLVKCFHTNFERSIDEYDIGRYKMQFSYDGKSENCLHGIINYLNKNGLGYFYPVNVSSSTEYINGYIFGATDDNYEMKQNPRNVIDFNDEEKYFETDNAKNSWIMLDFMDAKVRPTHYTIKCITSSLNNPKSWCIEGSNSNKENEWVILDMQNNIDIFNEDKLSYTFKINSNDKFYKYLRIRQTGFNTSFNYKLALSSVEFFGEVIKNSKA